MANLQRSDIVDVLNELLTEDLIDEYLFKDHPGLAMLEDADHLEFTGRYVHAPIQYQRGGGRSATFSNAQTNRAASKYDAFDVTLVSNYGTIGVDGLAMDLAKHGGSAGMFVNHLEQESKSGFEKLGDDLAHNMFRGISGSRGQRGSLAGSTVTMANISDIRFIELGDVIVASATETGGSVRSGSITVTAVDRDAGTFDFTGTITGFADNDYLYIQGDYDQKASGLDAWCPSAAPGATAFFGVDRSVAPVELGGMRWDGSGYQVEEMFVRLGQRLSRDSVSHDYYLCHPNYFGEISVALQGQRNVRNIDIESVYNGIGFEGLAVTIQGVGEKKIIQDPDCQPNVLWGIKSGTFSWYTLGDAPRKVTEDSLEWLRGASSDDYECRLVARHAFLSTAPWNILRTTVSSTQV